MSRRWFASVRSHFNAELEASRQALRRRVEHDRGTAVWIGLVGAVVLAAYGFTPTYQPADFGRGSKEPSPCGTPTGLNLIATAIVVLCSELAVPPVKNHSDSPDLPCDPIASPKFVNVEPLDDLLPA